MAILQLSSFAGKTKKEQQQKYFDKMGGAKKSRIFT